MAIMRHSRRIVSLLILAGAITLSPIQRSSAQEMPKQFQVEQPATQERFAAIQMANVQRQQRDRITPEYLHAANIFLDRCSSCHGEQGFADGPWHTEFHPEPANLSLVNDSREMLRSIILRGIPNTMMPAFPDLDVQTIDNVLKFVALQGRDLSTQWEYPWELHQKIGEEMDKPDLKEGRQQFVSQCVGCHGSNGAGDGVMAQDNYIWPKPADLRARNSDMGRLYFIITHGRQGTFMPPQQDVLPMLARWRVAQYVASLYNANQPSTMRHPSKDIPKVANPYNRADQETADYGRDRYGLWCSPCHASDARGSLLAPRLIDREWKYADGTDTAVWTIVKEGVPGKLMLSFDDLPEEERWKIITFLRFKGGLPDPLASEVNLAKGQAQAKK